MPEKIQVNPWLCMKPHCSLFHQCFSDETRAFAEKERVKNVTNLCWKWGGSAKIFRASVSFSLGPSMLWHLFNEFLDKFQTFGPFFLWSVWTTVRSSKFFFSLLSIHLQSSTETLREKERGRERPLPEISVGQVDHGCVSVLLDKKMDKKKEKKIVTVEALLNEN